MGLGLVRRRVLEGGWRMVIWVLNIWLNVGTGKKYE